MFTFIARNPFIRKTSRRFSELDSEHFAHIFYRPIRTCARGGSFDLFKRLSEIPGSWRIAYPSVTTDNRRKYKEKTGKVQSCGTFRGPLNMRVQICQILTLKAGWCFNLCNEVSLQNTSSQPFDFSIKTDLSGTWKGENGPVASRCTTIPWKYLGARTLTFHVWRHHPGTPGSRTRAEKLRFFCKKKTFFFTVRSTNTYRTAKFEGARSFFDDI